MAWAREVVAFGEVASEDALEWVAYPEAMQTAKCVRREALLTAGKTQSLVQTTDAARAAYLVLDFGRLLHGFPHLRLRGQAGAVIDLGFARAAGAVESRLRYVCRDGLQEWTAPQGAARGCCGAWALYNRGRRLGAAVADWGAHLSC